MGRTSREKPERLAEKLLQIRLALDLSQGDLLSRLGLSERLARGNAPGIGRKRIVSPERAE